MFAGFIKSEVHSQPTQTSKMELFTKRVNSFQSFFSEKVLSQMFD